MAENFLGRFVKEFYDSCAKQRRDSVETYWSMAYDAFVGEYSKANLSNWRELEGHDWRCKVFIRAARRKTISAVAQINDVYFQGGTLPFNLSPSKDAAFIPGILLPPAIADFRCANMKETITANLNRAKYERTLMASNLEKGIFGMSVHKCPVVKNYSIRSYIMQMPAMAKMIGNLGILPPEVLMRYARQVPVDVKLQLPTAEHINLWDYFWDMEASDHQSGIGNIHRVMMDPGMVRKLLDNPGYDEKQINALLDIPSLGEPTHTTSEKSEAPERKDLFEYRRNIEVVEFWGRVPKKYLGRHEVVLADITNDGREAEISVTFAYPHGGDADGYEIRKAEINRLPMQRRPFHVGYWETFPHQTRGVGIPENMQDSTLMQNGAWRAFVDNKALAGNLLMFYRPWAFKPGQDFTMRPGASFELEDWVQDVRQAMTWTSPPDIGQGLLEMLNVAERLGDEESGHPKLLQGETSRNAPHTAFETNQLLEAANKQLGQVVKNTDEGQIEPDIEAIYHFLMETHPSEEIKGAFDCQATGFSAYNDRIIKGNSIMQLMQFGTSNQLTAAYLNIPEHLKEAYKARNLDPDVMLRSQEEVDQQRAMEMAAALGVGGQPTEENPTGMPPGVQGLLPPGGDGAPMNRSMMMGGP